MSNPNYPEGVTDEDIDRIGEVNPLTCEDEIMCEECGGEMYQKIVGDESANVCKDCRHIF